MEKKENFENSCISFLYHLEIIQYKQIWLDLIGSFHHHFSELISLFLSIDQFMLKIAIFSAKGDFANIWWYGLHLNKNYRYYYYRHMTLFWKEERWGYKIYQN